MNRHQCAWLSTTFVLGIAMSSASAEPPAPAAPPDASPETAGADAMRTLFEEGSADLDAGKFADAAKKLRAVWQQRKSHDVAGNLGAALLQLGEHVEAARFLAYAAANHPVGGKPSVKRSIEELLAEARKKVTQVRLQVTGDAPAPEIRVDDAVVEPALVSSGLFVAPGSRTIEVSAKGYPATRKRIDAKAGEAIDVTLALMPAAAAEAPGKSMVGPAIAFGAGGVGLVVGIVAGAVSIAKFGDFEAACGPQLQCPRSLEGEVETGRALGHVSTAGFVIAGVGAAVGATLLLLPSSSKSPATVGVVVGPAFAGVKGVF